MTAGGADASYPSPPPPPPGPGVVPPFVAPPMDGVRQRRWLAVGLGGAAALLCCVGALFGFGGLVVLSSQVVVDQSRAAVTQYLTAIRDRDFSQAYALLCDARQRTTSLPQFERSVPRDLVSFTVGEPELTDPITVPATLRFGNGATDLVRYLVEQDSTTGDLEVCGQAD